jgi:hypothetical protein
MIDSSVGLVSAGFAFGLVILKRQQRLMKVILYPRRSKKYMLRVIVAIVLGALPLAVFMNPLWSKIILPDTAMVFMLYFLQGIGLTLGGFMLVGIAPTLLDKAKLE